MMYFITSTPPNAADGKIFTASNAEGYVSEGEIHLKDATAHFVHKPTATPPGWYMRNPATEQDYYLGAGASPTLAADIDKVHAKSLWSSIATDEETAALAATASDDAAPVED